MLSKYSRGEIAFTILTWCAFGILIGGILLFPNLAQVLTLFKPKNKYERMKIRRAVHSLAKQGLLERVLVSGNLKLTKRGSAVAEYENLQVKKQARWDKRWRLVMFDIPESQRPARIALSRKLVAMGMRHAQDSVFISPYQCEKEVLQAARFLRVEPLMHLATLSHLNTARRFEKEFRL